MFKFGAMMVALLVPCFVSGAVAQERWEIPDYRVYGAPASEADGAAIDTLLSNFQTAWGTEDAQTVADLHSTNVEWINAYARMFQSRDTLAVFLEERLFPAFRKTASESESGNMRPISRRYLGDDAAVIHLYTDGSRGPSVVEGENLRRTHLHFVLEKTDDTWSIAHVAIMDARR